MPFFWFCWMPLLTMERSHPVLFCISPSLKWDEGTKADRAAFILVREAWQPALSGFVAHKPFYGSQGHLSEIHTWEWIMDKGLTDWTGSQDLILMCFSLHNSSVAKFLSCHIYINSSALSAFYWTLLYPHLYILAFLAALVETPTISCGMDLDVAVAIWKYDTQLSRMHCTLTIWQTCCKETHWAAAAFPLIE